MDEPGPSILLFFFVDLTAFDSIQVSLGGMGLRSRDPPLALAISNATRLTVVGQWLRYQARGCGFNTQPRPQHFDGGGIQEHQGP